MTTIECCLTNQLILTGAKYRTPYNVGTARTSLLRSAYLRRYFDNCHVHALKVGNQQGVEPRSLFTRFRKVAQKCRGRARARAVRSGLQALFAGGRSHCSPRVRSLRRVLPARLARECCALLIVLLCVHTRALRAYTCSSASRVQPASTSSRLSLASVASHLHVRHLRVAALVACCPARAIFLACSVHVLTSSRAAILADTDVVRRPMALVSAFRFPLHFPVRGRGGRQTGPDAGVCRGSLSV